MIVYDKVEQLRLQIKQWRENGDTIAFVPTMGNLHAGHLSLVEIAKIKATRVVVSIYVNPLQFSPGEDFESYPRTLGADLNQLEALGVDLVFTPDNSVIYPEGEQRSAFVDVPVLSHIIEGEFRPDFFKGVATVVLKLFNMVQPDIAVFGEKDFQQLLIIKQLVQDFNLPITIVGGETKREADGLAMSSRNNYLSASERDESKVLAETLQIFRNHIEQEISIKQAESSCIETLENHGFLVDYVTLRETSNLDLVSDVQAVSNRSEDKNEMIILAAAKIGQTRLIDNLKFTI
ncbi:MAG: pantoate--beta-alanine ligase [Gammaproteobacteria bacterium]|nr:pantoate--beta-alanine ligase [Gammaproteobacteria bacterium]